MRTPGRPARIWRRWLVLAALALQASAAFAIEIGPLILRRDIPPGLLGQFRVYDRTPIEASQFTIRLAHADAYAALGLKYERALANVAVSIEPTMDSGLTVLLRPLPAVTADNRPLDIVVVVFEGMRLTTRLFRVDLRSQATEFAAVDPTEAAAPTTARAGQRGAPSGTVSTAAAAANVPGAKPTGTSAVTVAVASVPMPAPAAATTTAMAPSPATSPAPASVPMTAPATPVTAARPAPSAPVVAAAKPASAPSLVAAAKAAAATAPAAAAVAMAPAKAPVATPAAPSAAPPANAADVMRAIERWADAWAGREVDAYAAAYVPEFRGTLPNRAAWVAFRRSRIMARRQIDIDLSEVAVKVEGARAEVRFVQKYRGDQTVLIDRKRLVLVRSSAGTWLIQEELTL
jgi:hypothetical protein